MRRAPLAFRAHARVILLSAACLLSLFYLHAPAPAARVTAATANDPPRELFETGSPASAARAAAAKAAPPAEIKIVSYNIRWRGGEDLLKLIEHLRADKEIGGADIIGLQEVDRDRERTKNVNTARQIAEALGMHYAWAAPPREPGDEEEPTGVALLSPHPITDATRLVLPHEGPGKRRRAAVGATVHVAGVPVRAYSLHGETRLKMELKAEQYGAALADLRRHLAVKHAVVVGDFNTIKAKEVRNTRRLFTEAGFDTPLPDERDTFHVLFFKFKLDWVWLRGLEATGHGVVERIGLSDHWPVWVTAKLGAVERDGTSTPPSSEPNAPPE